MNLFRISPYLFVLVLMGSIFSGKSAAADDPIAIIQHGTPEQKQQVLAEWTKELHENPAQYRDVVWQQWSPTLRTSKMGLEGAQLAREALDTMKITGDVSESEQTTCINLWAEQILGNVYMGRLSEATEILYSLRGKMIGNRPVASNQGVYLELSDNLVKAQRNQDAEKVILMGIGILPRDIGVLNQLLPLRAQALWNAKDARGALAAAKGYYNFVGLSDTSNAVNLLCTYLARANPTEHGIVNRVKAQQYAGMTGASTTQPADVKDNLIKSIAVDGRQFDDAIQALSPDKFDDLIARGNLLLIADRARDARDSFEAAEKLVREQEQMDLVVEGIAKSFRAEDSTVGRANAYIMSLREAK